MQADDEHLISPCKEKWGLWLVLLTLHPIQRSWMPWGCVLSPNENADSQTVFGKTKDATT